jgi:Ca2+/Na+ antiporter
MADFAELFATGRVMLAVGAVLLYVASRFGSGALAGHHADSPGLRAVGNWLPIAAAVIVSLIMRRNDWAISIIFATSVGCLSLVLGMICIVSPQSKAPPEYRTFWAFAVPAALLALLVGFAGNLNWTNAIILLAEGAGLLWAWREIQSAQAVAAEKIGPGRPKNETIHVLKRIDIALCILIAIIGAIAADLGARQISSNLGEIPDVAVVVAILSPILVLPMVTGAAALARENRTADALTSAIIVVLLNICLLLPLVGLLWYPLQGLTGNSLHTLHLNLDLIRNAPALPFAWITWRVDSVILVVLSFSLLPAAMGRWKLGWVEGFMLIAFYGVYLLMEAAAALRS